MLSLWLRRLSTDRIVRSRDSSPSPRIRGEGRGEGALRQAQNRGDAPSPVCHRYAEPAIGPASGRTRWADDLSPQAGRGKKAIVVTGKRGNVEVLTAVDEAAERLGLKPGLTLAQARAMHPGIDVVAEDIEADAALLESIADWCLRYTPLVACDAPDGLLLDISGCAHLYGGEARDGR